MQDRPRESQLFLHKYRPTFLEDFKDCYANTDSTDRAKVNNFRVIDLLQTLMQGDHMIVMVVGGRCTGKTTLVQALVTEYIDRMHYSRDNVMLLNTLRDQGIHFYRSDVRNFCQTASKLQRKVVIFDDIDLLSEQSQQVFRTCVDKFNAYCHFIITCTNIHNLNENLQSRFFPLRMMPLSRNQLEFLNSHIQRQEAIPLTEAASQKIMNLACQNICNVKILLSFLQKCKLLRPIADESQQQQEKKWVIDLNTVEELCSIISYHHYDNYIAAFKERNLASAISIITSLHDRGFSVMDILDNFFSYVKHVPDQQDATTTTNPITTAATTILTETQKYQLTKYICKYISYFHSLHEDEIELVLLTNNLYRYFGE